MNHNELRKKFEEYMNFANVDTDSIEWVTRLEKEEPIVISAVIARLGSTGTIGGRWNALRDSARTILESKLTEQIITTMEKLDKSGSRLTKVGIGLTVVVGILGLIVAL